MAILVSDLCSKGHVGSGYKNRRFLSAAFFIINGGLYVCIKHAGYMISGVFVYLVLWRVGGVC